MGEEGTGTVEGGQGGEDKEEVVEEAARCSSMREERETDVGVQQQHAPFWCVRVDLWVRIRSVG